MNAIPKKFQFPFYLHRSAILWRGLMDFYLGDLGAKSIMFGLLVNIAHHEGSCLMKLAKIMKLSHPAILRTIDEMEREGLIERRPAETDRRVKHLFITPKGEKQLERMFPVAHKVFDIACAGIDEKQLSIAADTLKQVFENIRGALDMLPEPKLRKS